MKRTKSKDPPRRLNLRAWERNIRPPGPDDPPEAIKKRLRLVITRPHRSNRPTLAAEMHSDTFNLTGCFCPDLTSVTGSSRLLFISVSDAANCNN